MTMQPDDERRRRESLRSSALTHVLAELGHDISTPLNVLVGRLSLLDDADSLDEAKGHAGPMRRQVDKLVEALEGARKLLPANEPHAVPLTELVEVLKTRLGIDVEVGASPTTQVLGDLDEAAACVQALLDHGGEASTDVSIEVRALERLPVRHLSPGDYVCVVLTMKNAVPEAETASWALTSARGHARRMRGAVMVPSDKEVLLALQPSG